MTKYTPDNVNDFDPDDVPAGEWDDYIQAYHEWRRREGLHVFGDDPNDDLEEYADQRSDYDEGPDKEWDEYSLDLDTWGVHDEMSRNELQAGDVHSERNLLGQTASPEHQVEQRQADLAAWEKRRKQQLEQWLAEWDEHDARSKGAIATDTTDPLNLRFEWHPQFQGKTRLDMYYQFRWSARHAKANWMFLAEHPSPSDEVRLSAAGAHQEWTQFGGPKGLDEDWDELALRRMVFEVARDQLQKMDYTFADFEREKHLDPVPAPYRSAVREAAVERGREDIGKGLGCAVLGAIITAVTYLGAQGGGSYYVMWGAFAWGGYMVLRGLLTILRNR